MNMPMADSLARPARVWACVVVHDRPPNELSRLLNVLRHQVEHTVVIDNSPITAFAASQGEGWTLCHLPHNPGTAGAYNAAWRQAAQAGVEHLLLLDQDSLPSEQHVAQLRVHLHAATAAVGSPVPVAMVGPRWIDRPGGSPAPVLHPIHGLRRFAREPLPPTVSADHLIASGSLVALSALEAIGGFDEDLFLDYVDVEWCLRARAKGWQVLVARDCLMQHQLGDSAVHLGSKRLAIHAPWRTGLQVRNHLLLWRKPHIPWSWLLSDAAQLAKKLMGLTLLAPHRWQRWACVAQGIQHGLRTHRPSASAKGPPPHAGLPGP